MKNLLFLKPNNLGETVHLGFYEGDNIEEIYQNFLEKSIRVKKPTIENVSFCQLAPEELSVDDVVKLLKDRLKRRYVFEELRYEPFIKEDFKEGIQNV